MLTAAALAFINHLLVGEPWAQARLRPFAGRTARLHCPPVALYVEIDAAGALRAAPETASDAAADVRLSLPPEALAALWQPRRGGDGMEGMDSPLARILSAIRIEGAADLAETLAFVLRNLRWDVEDDLSRFVGDMAARRLAQGGRAAFAGASRAAWTLAQNVAEYFSEENPLAVRRGDMAAFSTAIEALAGEAARLEQRLAQLDGRARNRTA